MAPIAGKWVPGLEDVHGHCGDGGVRAMAMLLLLVKMGDLVKKIVVVMLVIKLLC